MPEAPVSFSGAVYRAKDSKPATEEHLDEVLRDRCYDEATIERLVADSIDGRHPETSDLGRIRDRK